MEEEKKLEEERRLRERSDNWRERGLDQMMGGVLEIKKEDELKKVIVEVLAQFMTFTLVRCSNSIACLSFPIVNRLE